MALVTESPAFQVGIAFLLGMIGQVLARHLRLPGIVVLLALGVAAGRDGLDVLRPEILGHGLATLVAFAVAIILFEGGMALDLGAVRHQAKAIRGLVLVGSWITAIGGALAAHWLLGWEGSVAVLFGTLVVVTGPTVIQPILRRIRAQPRVATILESEAIFGDAVGATVAVVALELALAPTAGDVAQGWRPLVERFGFGALIGAAAGALVAVTVRSERLVPRDLKNVFALAVVVAAYQIGEAARSECGVVVAIVAGLVVGTLSRRSKRKLHEFKEELTSLLLGLLFVLLAADIRLDEIRALGWPAVGVVAALVFLVRPLNVLVSTAGTDLAANEKAFLAWLAPRGIVAAAVSSHFADVLDERGVAGGDELRALVFLVIASTVVVQGLSAGPVARWLGVARGPRSGWAILGANGLGIALAERLNGSAPVVLVDSSSERCREARERGLTVIEANGLDEETITHPEIEARRGVIATTANEEVNFIFARRARELLKTPEVCVALRAEHPAIQDPMLAEIGAKTLFGRERRLDLWALRVERELVRFERRVAARDATALPEIGGEGGGVPFLPLVLRRGGEPQPYAGAERPRSGDEVEFALFVERLAEARALLDAAGWREPETSA